MSRRTTVLLTLIEHIASSTSSIGFRGMRFLHEVNSFPAFYVHPQNESRVHQGDGSIYAVQSLSIRGYQYSDNLGDIELFMRSIETAIQSFRSSYRDMIDEARVVSVRTDEGTMAPYGIVDMDIQLMYSVIEGYHQPTATAYYLATDENNQILTVDEVPLSIPTEFK